MKILLTGDKGFIGTHLRKKLEGLGHKIEGCDYKVRPVEDIRNTGHLQSVFARFKPEIVIHLAARAGVRESEKEPTEYITTNVGGTYNLLKLSDKHKIKNFLFISSSSIYGSQKGALKEDMICDNPLSLYGITKKVGELLCLMFKDLSTVVIRPFTVYGENGREEMVVRRLITAGQKETKFYKYGEGTSIRGYTNVHDLVDGIIKAIDYRPKDNYDVLNLGGAEQIRLNDLIKIVKKQFPSLKVEETERHSADVFSSYADVSKARRLLNWKPIRKFNQEINNLCQI